MNIEHLTRAQSEQLPRWRAAWLEVVSDTAPVDRARAEEAIAQIYEDAGEGVPVFVWVRSPAAAAFAIAWFRSLKESPAFERRVGVGAGQQLQQPLLSALHRGVTSGPPVTIEDWFGRQVGTHLAWQLRNQISQPITEAQTTHAVWDELCGADWAVRTSPSPGRWSPSPDFVGELVGRLGPAETTQWLAERAQRVAADLDSITPVPTDDEDWAWRHDWLSMVLFNRPEGALAKYAFARAVLGIALPGLEPWETVTRACGLWWPLHRVCIACERPTAVHRDDRGRLHHASRAALQFGDGFSVHAWHGTQVPAAWITQPDRLDPRSALDRQINVERRRAAAEIVGWSRVLEHASVRVIDRNPDPMIGELLEVMLPPDRDYTLSWDGEFGPYSQRLPPSPARFLRVRCATGRDFVLSVPLQMSTALEANAWTYGMNPEDYQLEVRT